MAATDATPINQNYLSPLGWEFHVPKLPHVNFFVQRANIPGIALTDAQEANPFVAIPHHGEHLTFEPLSVTFKVDEDMRNYIEVYRWLRGLGFPRSFDEHARLAADTRPGEGIKTDAVLTVLTSARNPNIEIVFEDIHPIAIDGISFETRDDDVNHVTVTVEFAYTKYEIRRVGEHVFV